MSEEWKEKEQQEKVKQKEQLVRVEQQVLQGYIERGQRMTTTREEFERVQEVAIALRAQLIARKNEEEKK